MPKTKDFTASESAQTDLPSGTVTFLFTDIEGSTRLLKQLGDHYAQVLATQRQTLRAAFERWEGQEVDTQGDSFFVAFARASDAVSAAALAQESMAMQSWPGGQAVRVRMGLHTGEARVTEEGYVGMDVHRAARICSAGHGGQILLSPSTAALVMNSLPEGFHLRDLGEHRLKDLSWPEHLFQLNIPGQPSSFPPLKSLNAMPNNLPAQLTSFIGRKKEIEQLIELLRDVRLITITGPGGSGKSRLALQAAANLIDQFPDGVWFVPLATLVSTEEIAPAIANVLRFNIDTFASNLDPANQLLDYLSNRILLLVLDNFEHLLDGIGFIKELLSRALKVKVIITSRERLNIPEEWVFALSGMDYPHNGHHGGNGSYSALDLFQERARQTNPAYRLSPQERPFASTICRLVEGSPLGIELAAPWTVMLSCEEIAQELEQGMDFLTDTMRSLPEGHRSLRVVFEHSWRLLNEVERNSFCSLSVFQGGFDRFAAQQVAGVNLPLLMDLINKSLVQSIEGQRFQMHALLHQFATEQLKAQPEQEKIIRETHSHYYINLLEKWQTSVPGDTWQQALERMLKENRNIRDAMHWALIHWSEVEAGQALDNAYQFFLAQGFFEASQAYRSIIQFLKAHGARLDVDTPLRTLLIKAIILKSDFDLILGDLSAVDDLRACYDILRGQDLKFELGGCLQGLGINAVYHCEYKEAINLLEESYLLLRETNFVESTAGGLLFLGWAYLDIGDYSNAQKRFLEAYQLSKQLGVGIMRPYALDKLGTWADATGDYAQGLKYHEEALQSFEQLGYQSGQSYALSRMSLSAWGLGDYARALEYGQAGLKHFESINHRWGRSICHCRIGYAQLGLENYTEAQEHFMCGLRLSQEYQYPAVSIFALIGLAYLLARQGKPEKAVEVLTFASQHPAAGPLYRELANKELAVLQASLEDEKFSTAQQHGRTLELDSLVEKLSLP